MTVFRQAEEEHGRAVERVHAARQRLGVAAVSGVQIQPYLAGVALEERRILKTAKHLNTAQDAFTEGRSLLEALWCAPDEV